MAIGENGGAESIRKFNYQHSVAMMFLISNLDKEEFSIFPESADDLMIKYGENTINVQVKGTDGGLTINALKKVPKGKQKSIIHKSLEVGGIDDYRIIVFWKITPPQTKNYVEESFPLSMLDETIQVSKLSQDNRDDFIKQYSNINGVVQRLEKHYFLKTPFEATIPSFKQWLIFKIVDLDFIVEKKVVANIYDSLLSIVAQKSELKMEATTDNELKRIDKSIIDQFLVTRDESYLYDEILRKLELPAHAEKEIMDCKFTVDTLNSSFLDELGNEKFEEDFTWLKDNESVELVISKIEKMSGSENLSRAGKYAIAITFLSRI
ncbi:dsDNA nuclease domain-containing protein [Weissella cibaria]|uniref:dsDNA nuclease domain-containing protein n=1 Tax=Weissella cibaria TaxID=137591 RepID=UPI0018981564|nr:dsDNA nuclease domain-containing protein [Weissella cibaria]